MRESLINRTVSLVIILFCQVFACTSPQQDVSPASKSDAYREYFLEGVRVLVPEGITTKTFYPDAVKPSDPNARAAANVLTLDDLTRIAKPIVEKYPDLGSYPLQPNHLEEFYVTFLISKTNLL